MTAQAIYWAALGLLGLCLGSFVTTAAIRVARGEGFFTGRSHCDDCNAPLDFRATLPLVSYLGRGGAARCCRRSIDAAHPLGEFSGLAIVLVSAKLVDPIATVLVAGMGFLLLALALIDLKTHRLPDSLTAAVAVVGLALSISSGASTLIVGAAAAVVAFVVVEGIRLGYLKFRGENGLGGGDVKLLAALALWLGVLTPAALAMASMLGLLQVMAFRPRSGRIAFGPAIALCAFVLGTGRLILMGAR